jgi:hypothetical protein
VTGWRWIAITRSSSAARSRRVSARSSSVQRALQDLLGVGIALAVLRCLGVGVGGELGGCGVQVTLELDQVVGDGELVSHGSKGTCRGRQGPLWRGAGYVCDGSPGIRRT